MQLSMDTNHKLTRTTAPKTSHDAAEVKGGIVKEEVLAQIKIRPATSTELYNHFKNGYPNISRSTVRARLTDLQDLGLVESMGRDGREQIYGAVLDEARQGLLCEARRTVRQVDCLEKAYRVGLDVGADPLLLQLLLDQIEELK